MSRTESADPRITVVIPCYNDGEYLRETIDSIREPEEVSVVVVDDGSSDPGTLACYPELEERGIRVLRHDGNRGLSQARNTGLAAATTPYVFDLDSDDLLLPGVLSRMAALLDVHPEADVAFGDYEEFGARAGVRRTAPVLDPYRVVYVNKQPGLAMFRREVLQEVGGWYPIRGYEDWDLWMTLAERGTRVVHTGEVVFRYRLHPGRLFAATRDDHDAVYAALRARHPRLVAERHRHRRTSGLPLVWKLAYPLLYVGGRPRLEGVRRGVRRVLPMWSPGLRQKPATHASADS